MPSFPDLSRCTHLVFHWWRLGPPLDKQHPWPITSLSSDYPCSLHGPISGCMCTIKYLKQTTQSTNRVLSLGCKLAVSPNLCDETKPQVMNSSCAKKDECVQGMGISVSGKSFVSQAISSHLAHMDATWILYYYARFCWGWFRCNHLREIPPLFTTHTWGPWSDCLGLYFHKKKDPR